MATVNEMDADAALVAYLAGCHPVLTLGYLRRATECVKVLDCDGLIVRIGEVGRALARARHGPGAEDIFVGKPLWDLWGVEMQPAIRAAVMRARLGHAVECDVVDEAAGLALEVEFTPVRDGAGDVRHLLVVSRSMQMPASSV